MPVRDIGVRFDANVTGFVAGMGKASASVNRFATNIERDLDRSARSVRKHQAAYNNAGDSLIRMGIVGGVALAGAAKAAVDWETAWTGVQKTVNASTAQFASLEASLRQMARTMPTTHKDIAAVAEAAGQMGVAVPIIDEFTKVMVQLGDTTNLTAQQSAAELAKFVNIMGTTSDEIDNLGATIVHLGNTSVSTEKDIVDMGQRIAGAGAQFGLTEEDVLSFAAAISSVGIRSEAGGTAFSTTLIKINTHVKEAGEGLETLADISGVTSEEFARLWASDPAEAVTILTEGLGKMQESGGNAVGMLRDLGIVAVRERDTLLRLASANNLVRETLADGAKGWEQNSALAIEAARRYATTESQVRISINNIRDAAIDLGGVLLPVIGGIAETVTQVSQAFGTLSPEVQEFIIRMGGIVTVGALAGGGMLKLVSAGSELAGSLQKIGAGSKTAQRRIRRLGIGAGVATASFLALAAASSAFEARQRDTSLDVERATRLLIELSIGARDAGEALDRNFTFERGRVVKDRIEGIGDALNKLQDPSAALQIEKFFDDLGLGASLLGDIEKNFESLDASLVNMAQAGSLDMAQQSFQELAEEVEKIDQATTQAVTGGRAYQFGRQWAVVAQEQEKAKLSAEDLIKQFPGYKAELERIAESLGVVGLETEDWAEWMQGRIPAAVSRAMRANEEAEESFDNLGERADKATQDLEELVDALFDYQHQALATSDAQITFHQAMADARKEARKGKKTLDIFTQAGRDNRRALDEMANSTLAYIEQQVRNGATTGKVTKITKRAREEFIEVAMQMGATQKEAERLANKYGLIPEQVKTKVSSPGMKETQNEAKSLQEQLEAMEGTHKVRMDFRILTDGKQISFDRASRGGYSALRAAGGMVFGPGGPTSDSIPAMLSNREFVQPTRSVDYYGVDVMEAIRRRLIPPEYFRAMGFRDGGLVTPEIQVIPSMPGVDKLSDMLSDASDNLITRGAAIVRSTMMSSGFRLGSDRLTQWHGGTFTENFARHLQLVYGLHPFQVFQGGWRPATSYSGTSHRGDAVDTTAPDSSLVRLMRLAGIAYWDRTNRGPWVAHGHGVPLPGSGIALGSGRWQAQDYLRGGDGLGGLDYHPRPVGSLPGVGSGMTSLQQMVRSLMLLRWPASQWPPLRALIQGESGWNITARNPYSGAYGLPQALPGSKMASAGPDWRYNPETQARWMFGYISGRYGTPANAYATWLSRSPHWYRHGGYVTSGRTARPEYDRPRSMGYMSPMRGGSQADVASIVEALGRMQLTANMQNPFTGEWMRQMVRLEANSALRHTLEGVRTAR